MIHKVFISDNAAKDLKSIPIYLVAKLKYWIDLVEKEGLEMTRTRRGFNDEALKGKRAGQRSIRLNQAYRAIYIIGKDQSIDFVSIEEVTNHDY